MNYIKKSVFTGVIFLHAIIASPCQSAEFEEQQIDALVAKAQSGLNVPGIALAVIKGDKIIHAKGYGVQSIINKKPIDQNSLFQIGSITKSFLTATLAMLVDENKIKWDDKVIDYLPQFQMYDPWVTREFTIRDLVTHRSGLPLGAGDLLQWPDAKSSPDEIIAALRHLKPESSFRSSYAYNNLMYVVAEEVIRVITGIPWDQYAEKVILKPLNMRGCVAHSDRIVASSERAIPHMEVDGELKTAFFKEGDLIHCSIEGMAQWAKLHLLKGQLPNGRTLISQKQHQEMWQPVTLQKVSYMAKTYSQTHFQAYGLGWRLMDFHGHLHVSHGGAVQGMTSHIAFLPEKNIAVVALTNQWSRAAQGLTATILESYVTDNPTDYIDLYIDGRNRYKSKQIPKQATAELQKSKNDAPTLPLENYTGRYHDDWYGDVFVDIQNNTLTIKFSRSKALNGTLEHIQGNRFVAKWKDRTLNADAYVNFEVNFKGKVKGIKMKAVSRSTDFSYNFHDLNLIKRTD
ncbi:hypothetical protein N474_01910 [Pseudoalteromonas luteoviolacea CPMOR-2]|uniref:serine hydrolase n=1 Tax=Pseudoalteromonas luteoviolacea TaxID=43657 RepID=UPI0007B1677A|nr:serine hydrolase [Pseudoalteromonas luteoviolacea]KZN54499.1 hypothetical protein N474_01910 [Pseudoalteromonas luteoviolacea CPMOR-2]